MQYVFMQWQLYSPRKGSAKCHCDGANHSKCQKAFESTRLLGSFGFTKATDPLLEQVCCRGLDLKIF